MPLLAKGEVTATQQRRDGDGCGCEAPAPGNDDAPPIACSLHVGQMGTRLHEWEALLNPEEDTRSGVVARTIVEGGMRLEFGPGTDVTELARLASGEQACCRFFRFDLTIDTRGVALEVRAPVDATDIVTALFGAPA